MDSLSAKNPLLKEIRRAVSRGTLTEEGYAVAEGAHLVADALAAGCDIRAVVVSESARDGSNYPEARTVTDQVFRDLASTETPQGVLALVRPPQWSVEQISAGDALVMVLDGVQDPGNAGAILRTAEAFGATGAIFLKGTVNPYNPKCMRGSAGSVFRLPLASGIEEDAFLEMIENAGLSLYAAMPHGDRSRDGQEGTLGKSNLTRRCAIVIGSEGRGVSPKIAERAIPLRIPTVGVESLNAGVAAGVLLYEARRQRDEPVKEKR